MYRSGMVRTAAEAFALFEQASPDDLAMKIYYDDKTPRRLPSGILKILGEEIREASDCPSTVMPLWLAKAVPSLFEARFPQGYGLPAPDAAKTWGLKFYNELKRLDGKVPFSVIHDWHANTIGELIVKASTLIDANAWRGAERPKALQALHADALAGRPISADEWRRVLYDAFLHIHAGGKIGPESVGSRRSTVDENATFYASAYADAYASSNAEAFARAHLDPLLKRGLDAYADGVVTACALIKADDWIYENKNKDFNYDRLQHLQGEWTKQLLVQLADGLLEALTRAEL
jgi:hypothetical protein